MHRVLVIGLDGATFRVLDPLINSGKLKTIKNMIENGVRSTLQSTIPPYTPAAWSSMITGVNPGKHGLVDFYYFDKNYNLKISNSTNRKYPSLFKRLSDAGYRCIVYNVPMTFPPEKVNGILISGFDTPSLESDFTYPKELKKELLRKFPNYKIFTDSRYSEKSDKDKATYLEELHEVLDLNFDCAEFLNEKFDWDFFMIVTNVTDVVQHYFWKYYDKKHPSFVKDSSKEFKNAIDDIYIHCDERLEKFLKKIPRDCIVFLVSDHGAGPFNKHIIINNILINKGYLKFRNSFLVRLKRMLYSIGITPEKIVKLITKYRSRNLGKIGTISRRAKFYNLFGLSPLDYDWERTVAYSVGEFGGIYLNTRLVNTKTYKSLRNEIVNTLQEVFDPATEEKLLDGFWFKEEIYSGHYVDKLPDVQFSFKNFSYTSWGVVLPSRKVFMESPGFKSGSHTLQGVFVAYGNGIKKGEILNSVKIYDIAPTIYYIFNIPIYRDIDGKVLKDIFEEDSEFHNREIVYADSPIEKEKIKHSVSRLKVLEKI